MRILNIGDVTHRYRDMPHGGNYILFHPGEPKEVTVPIGLLLLEAHPTRFIDLNAVAAEKAEMAEAVRLAATSAQRPASGNLQHYGRSKGEGSRSAGRPFTDVRA